MESRLAAIEAHCNAHPGADESIQERLARVEAHCHVHPEDLDDVPARLDALERHCNIEPPAAAQVEESDEMAKKRGKKRTPPRDSKGRFKKKR